MTQLWVALSLAGTTVVESPSSLRLLFGMGALWLILLLLVALALVGAGVRYFLQSSRERSRLNREKELQALHKRYIRGEIDRETYTKRRQELEE